MRSQNSDHGDLEDIYRELHRHPELSFQEHNTAALVERELRGLGFDVIAGLGGTGVVGVLMNGDGPTVMLRADMDALPVDELTGLDYASVARGVDQEGRDVPVMHACGHDDGINSGFWSGSVPAAPVKGDSDAIGRSKRRTRLKSNYAGWKRRDVLAEDNIRATDSVIQSRAQHRCCACTEFLGWLKQDFQCSGPCVSFAR